MDSHNRTNNTGDTTMGFWNLRKPSNAKQRPSDGERTVQEIIQRVTDENQRARENWESQDHSDLDRILGIQNEQLAEVRKIFLPYAWKLILSADGVEDVEPMNEMLMAGATNMMGRLPGAAEQSVFMWYVTGITDIGRMLVKARAQTK
jgi:hypothetical protein